jgi:transposase-like protein
MIHPCPHLNCESYKKNEQVVRFGKFYRQDTSEWVSRFKCKTCLKTFSSATNTLEFRHKKRRINYTLMHLLCSGVSQRRSAKILLVDKKTIARKVNYLAMKARENHLLFLQQLENAPVLNIQFDDLVTSIHTKLKPVTVTVAIDKSNRAILSATVGVIPAFGKLAGISKEKYGKRDNEHRRTLEATFKTLKPMITEETLFESDEHKLYPKVFKQYFNETKLCQFKGMKSTVAGLGELKMRSFDPLFSINHTLAMLRANINRLFRRTWCTSKDIFMLQNHIDIYVNYHNTQLI